MEFRPCIDIHNGQVKQIVGGTLRDAGDAAAENFVSQQDAAFYARLYRRLGLRNGHIILLNPASSPHYEATKRQALAALAAWPGALQVGGGICADNAAEFLAAGASHVIVTSYVFSGGQIDWSHLAALEAAVGREHLVLDLSCRRRGGQYFIVTDRWQTFTDTEVTAEHLLQLAAHCDEFLVHAADVEGKARGVEQGVVRVLAEASRQLDGRRAGCFPITYAGGIGSIEDLRWVKAAGEGRIHVTIGSALDLFGGRMSLDEVLRVVQEEKAPARRADGLQ